MGSRMNYHAGNVLFVADLPDETCEEDLHGIFNDYHLVVTRVTNRLNKTFALAHFESPEWAEKARNELNGIKIAAKYATIKVQKPIRLCRWETKQSITERKEDDYKKNLLVKNLSKDVAAHLFWMTFRKLGDVRSSKLAVNYNGESKGYGYITYYNVVDAENARNKLNGTELLGKQIVIDFLQPGIKRLIKKNNIYVKHFPKETFNEEDLRKLFSQFGELVSTMVAPDPNHPKANKGFGFVCFKNPEDAEKAQRELNGKKIWEDLVPLYVSFAMRKEERLEHLQRQKEEQIKSSYKMTIFCRIKEGVMIEDDRMFVEEIMSYFLRFFGPMYSPKNLRPRIETRTAFVTVNTPKEADDFIKLYTEFSKSNPVSLYFNQYKSKIERLNTANKMKKYNDFNSQGQSGMGMNNMGYMMGPDMKQPMYKNYNEFGMNQNPMMMHPQMPMMNQMPMNQQMGRGNFVNYNNFEMPDQMNNLNNNFNQMNIQGIPQITRSQEELEEEEKGDILDRIYGKVSKIYEADAPKITGMIAELTLADLRDLMGNEQRLDGVIKSAFHQLHN